MKTQQEIEKMKDKIGEEISELSTLIFNCNNVSDITYMSEKSRQKQAQYNILLEVLR